MDLHYEKHINYKVIEETTNIFRNRIEKEWEKGKVMVLFEYNNIESFIFVERNEIGYPLKSYFNFVNMNIDMNQVVTEEEYLSSKSIIISDLKIVITKPLMFFAYYDEKTYERKTKIGIWQAEIMHQNQIPLEKLELKYLQKIVNKKIKGREENIITETNKNKLIK